MSLKKRIGSLLLLVVLISALISQVAFAQASGSVTTLPGTETPAVEQEVNSPYAVLFGTIKRVTIEGNVVHVEVLSQHENKTIILNITDTTKIVDSVKRVAVAPKDLVVGSTVYAWHSTFMTKSYPPIANAEALIVNVPKDGAPGQFFEVEKVTKNKDGSITILNAEQDLYFTIPKNTKIALFNTDKTIRLSNIKPGTKLVVWYEVAALSYPAQAGGSEVIAFSDEYDGYVSVINKNIRVNGSSIRYPAVLENGTVWLPAQEVAKKLGFSTNYKAKSKALTLKKSGKVVAVITAGKDTFMYQGEERGITAPVIKDGRLYVEMPLFAQLGNFKLANPIR